MRGSRGCGARYPVLAMSGGGGRAREYRLLAHDRSPLPLLPQIEYLLDGCLPDDLSACLVFSASQLRRLQARVDELEEEKAGLRAAHKELRRQHAALLRDKADKEARVAELEARAHDVQMLKFGQVIDLELLDRVSSSRGTEELREDLKKQVRPDWVMGWGRGYGHVSDRCGATACGGIAGHDGSEHAHGLPTRLNRIGVGVPSR